MLDVAAFRETIYAYYRENRRSFPWRETYDPYKILVSEIMLQQTQADRVVSKYEAFLARFPTLEALAKAEPAEVLKNWSGLGYNRRALSLQKIAQKVVGELDGQLPEDLESLPGIGPYTAGAIRAFAFNKPSACIETNIRRVYLHFFFPEADKVSDKELLSLIEETVDRENPREWYYALMDYGFWLAKTQPNANVRSKHYTKQGKFQGSNRQLRGMLLKLHLANPSLSPVELSKELDWPLEQIQTSLATLENEGFFAS